MRDKWAKKRMRRRQRKKRKMKKWAQTNTQGVNSTCNLNGRCVRVGRPHASLYTDARQRRAPPRCCFVGWSASDDCLCCIGRGTRIFAKHYNYLSFFHFLCTALSTFHSSIHPLFIASLSSSSSALLDWDESSFGTVHAPIFEAIYRLDFYFVCHSLRCY